MQPEILKVFCGLAGLGAGYDASVDGTYRRAGDDVEFYAVALQHLVHAALVRAKRPSALHDKDGLKGMFKIFFARIAQRLTYLLFAL
jgi:hypothetical protein